MNLEDVRAELPVLERCAFLNAGTFGPLPRASLAAQIEQHQRELEEGRAGARYYERIHELRTGTRAGIAAMLGADAEHVALTRSTGEGCAITVGGLGLEPGDEVVTTDVEHFGLLGPLAISGATTRIARIRDKPAAEALATITDLIGPRTKLIALSHVAWSTGHVLPVGELAATGVPVLVDGAQSVGAIPVNVAELGCDFYTVSGQKWLLGPDATGGLYVHPRWCERLNLVEPSYFGRTAHDELGVPEPSRAAARFDPGALPLPSLAALVESLGFHNSIGGERFERARAQTERCRERLAERVDVITEPGHSTLISFRTADPSSEVVERLRVADVHVREIPDHGWVRASIGFWTADDELERLLDVL